MLWNSSIPKGADRHPGRGLAVWICGMLLCLIAVPQARAGFIGYYAPENFAFTDIIGGVVGLGTPNGSAIFSDASTLVLTGSQDGSGLEGTTDLTITAAGAGFFRFDFIFADLVIPTPDPFNPDDPYAFPYGGFLLGNTFTRLSDATGSQGSVSVPVMAGELIGFRVGGDNQGGPGVLTITNFAAPVPEPGTSGLLLLAVAVLAGVGYRRRMHGA